MSTAEGTPKDRFLLTDASLEDPLERSYDLALLKRLFPYAKAQWPIFLIAFGLMPVSIAASLFQPVFLKRAIDAAVVTGSDTALASACAGFATALGIEFVSRFSQTYSMQLGGLRTTASLRTVVFGHIQRLRVSYFDRTPVGRVVTRVTNDIDALTELFASGAVTAVSDLLMLTGIVIAMLAMDWKLSLVVFACMPFLAGLVERFRRRAREAFRRVRAAIAQLNGYMAEQVQGISVVQAYGREGECGAEYDGINDEHRQANYMAIRYDALLYSVVESFSMACMALVLIFAGREVGLIEDEARALGYVGTVIAFYDYIQRFFVPIRDLSTKYTIIQSSLAASERIFGMLDLDEPDAPAGVPGRDGDVPEGAALVFDDVTFAYREGQPVLHGVSLAIQKGERVAIVGSTGSGKSTLTNLLLRLYDVQEGRVVVGGRDVRHYERHALRGQFSFVPQDVFLFAGTIRDNIAIDGTIDDARALACLERVGAGALVQERGGLDARVEERGQNFSAGERQLLAFARALYRDAPFLVLDEATANVDSETEARLDAAVASVLEGRTSLVIAHRLSTVRSADRIVVMQRGEIVEEGGHEALLEAGGVYAKLHALHFADHAAE